MVHRKSVLILYDRFSKEIGVDVQYLMELRHTNPIHRNLRSTNFFSFLKPGAKALPISLNKEFTRKSPRNERDYSPGIKFPKSLAPAKTQSRALFLILSNKIKELKSLAPISLIQRQRVAKYPKN
jgi:hypothetical protein